MKLLSFTPARLRHWSVALATVAISVFVLLPASSVLAQGRGGEATPVTPSNNIVVGGTCTLSKPSFFGLPTWWEFIKDGQNDGLGGCDPNVAFPNGLLLIGLAILDILLHVAGFAAVIFIIIAGIMFITSTGNPDRTRAARSRIINTLVGLGIVLIATAVVSFIGQHV